MPTADQLLGDIARVLRDARDEAQAHAQNADGAGYVLIRNDLDRALSILGRVRGRST